MIKGAAPLSALQRSFWEPVVRLAENVSYFRGPYESLLHEYGGFSPEIRFIEDRRLSGDPLAELALQGVIADARALAFKEPVSQLLSKAPGEFLESNRGEFDAFKALHYPWLGRNVIVDLSRPVEHSLTDELFESTTVSFLKQFSLTALKVTKRKGEAWRCRFELGGLTISISFEKGTRPWVRANAYLEVRELIASCPLGYAFGFSGTTFYCSADDDLEGQLGLFFAAYQRLFGDFLGVLEQGIRATNHPVSSDAAVSPRGVW